MTNKKNRFMTRLPFLASVILFSIKSATLTNVQIDGKSTNYTIHYNEPDRRQLYKIIDSYYVGELTLTKRYFLILNDLLWMQTIMHQKENPLTDWKKFRFKSNIRTLANSENEAV